MMAPTQSACSYQRSERFFWKLIRPRSQQLGLVTVSDSCVLAQFDFVFRK
jgi:hypothetical protein